MGKPVPKTSALVVSAIRKLREVQGSTSREIMNFITAEYDVPGSTIKKQLHAALKRGLEYGILKRQHGHYTLSTDDRNGGSFSGTIGTVQEEEDGSIDPTDACGKKRRKYRKCKKTRRCARGCVPNRRKKKSCDKKRRHSRRKSGGCPKRCVGGGGGVSGSGGGNIEGENLSLSPLDNNNVRSTRDQIKSQRSNHSNRTNRQSRSGSRRQSQSRSQSRSRSRSRSRSGNSGRETSTDRREKQAE